jgi:hypothetical protein
MSSRIDSAIDAGKEAGADYIKKDVNAWKKASGRWYLYAVLLFFAGIVAAGLGVTAVAVVLVIAGFVLFGVAGWKHIDAGGNSTPGAY